MAWDHCPLPLVGFADFFICYLYSVGEKSGKETERERGSNFKSHTSTTLVIAKGLISRKIFLP
jgi:hypothetical protein